MRLLVIAFFAACSSSSASAPDECASVVRHLTELAAHGTDLDRAAADGWSQGCSTYSADERGCLARSAGMAQAYACVKPRLDRELDRKATVASDEARTQRTQADPACAALWQHYVEVTAAAYGPAQAADVRKNLELAPDAEIFAHACPSYADAERHCMTAARTDAAFKACYTEKQRHCMADAFTVDAYAACMK